MELKIIKRKAAIILFMAVILVCMLPSIVMATATVTQTKSLDSNGEIKLSTDNISITAGLGYKGKYKIDKSIIVNAVINNKGSDFTGKFRVEYSSRTTDGSVVSQKTFAAASGEEKRVQFTIPGIDADSIIKFALCDENNKELCKEYVYLNSNNFSVQLYIGALSDNQDSLNYISNEMAADKTSLISEDEGCLFELESTDITSDAKMLEALDVIIVDDFDTGKLSEGQVEALKDWINDGGMLMLGSGADADKVLKAFSGSLLNGTIGNARSIRTNFGVSRKELTKMLGENLFNKRVPLDITRLRIRDSKPVVTDGKERLISSVSYGKGKVLVSEFSLGLGSEAAKLYGRLIVNTIKNNLSDNRKNYMGLKTSYAWNSYNGIYGYYENEALLLNETDSLPNLKLYGVLLIVYVILAGPIAYIITKKKDKRNLLWGIIPVLSAAFSITIYLIGTSTRIQKPYINYISTIELPEKESGKNTVKTVFALTSSSNKSYEALLPSESDISPAYVDIRHYYASSASDMESDNGFDYGIEYGAENTKLMMNSLSAFESVYFQINNKSSATGVVEINASKKDNKISGIVNNKMSCDLEDCIFYDKGTIYYIGDFQAGRAFDLSKTPKSDIYEESKYSFSLEDQLEDVLGGSYYNNSTTNDIKRKYSMIMKFIYENRTSSSWFYGFVPDGEETGFLNVLEYDKYGATGVYKAVDVVEKIDGYDIIGSLEEYAYDYNDNQTNGYYVYDQMNQTLEVKYKFPDNFSLKKVIYNETTAGGGEYRLGNYGYAESAFVGEARVLDKDTGDYVTIIKSTQDAEIDDIEKYLEDDGTLTIYYDISYNQYGSVNVDSLILPKVKLAGRYKRR